MTKSTYEALCNMGFPLAPKYLAVLVDDEYVVDGCHFDREYYRDYVQYSLMKIL